jgi:hypothetical protein
MSFFERIKRFFTRNSNKISYDNALREIHNNISMLVRYLGEAPAPCDKCSGMEDYCFKCEGTGVVKNKHLCDWPWED